MTDNGSPLQPNPEGTLLITRTRTHSRSGLASRGDSLQTSDLSLPQTIIVPPTPITARPANSDPHDVNLSAPLHTMAEETVQYESPDDNSDMDAPPRASPSDERQSSRPPLPPHAMPLRVASTPVPRSKSMASHGKDKERDDSALLQSPPTFVPVGLTESSPHLFSAQRTPSPSSPGPSHFRERAMRSHKRTSSSHVVHETTLGLQHEDDEGARVVNQYKIGHGLGSGAYASVFLGIDVGDGTEYAIKEFSKARLQRQALMERQAQMARERRNRRPLRPGPFPAATEPLPSTHTAALVDDEMLDKDPLALIRREVAVMKKLDHPHLTKLYEAISVPNADGLYLVLEYLPGGVLMKVEPGYEPTTDKPPFTEDEAREYFRQICLGLEYLHSNGIAHRDIKPDNILFTKNRDMVKLADFGVSEMFQGDDTIKAAGGSPAFLSPESFNANIGQIHGKAVDIWALGVTLYCMLCGKLPFNVANPVDLMWMVREKEPEIPDEWHRDLQHLMRGMLCKDPHKRFTMSEIRENPWVNAWGQQPMRSIEDNLFYYGNVFEEPTEEEVDNALISLRSVFTVVRAVHKMRRAVGMRRQMTVMHEAEKGLSPSDGDVSLTSGSMDSYTLPDAVTGVQTPSEMSEDEVATIMSSPEREDTPEPPSNVKKPGGWARLRPLKTDLVHGTARKGTAKTMPNVEPHELAAEPKEMAAEPIEVGEPTCMSPVEVASPTDVHDSPNLIAESPVLMAESPVEHDSPNLIAESPVLMAESPVEHDSPIMLADSPVMADSPLMANSPNTTTPPPVITPLQTTPVTSKIVPAMEPLSLDATPTQRTCSNDTDGAVSPQQL
ncbi:hypothetical protein CspeluHIS016_0109950 [Cutaneotrichosporon spelunceum]|uniref:Protein kinase domain-containing protein n=1 Tax=Cutaneotrichosporon spelunceum TaxID=1672016 RepID=A0AAD3TPR0_9TREE|nr:hypothetical protein CspeluHIS016_0109950 [Cutaneotrichosporon spelunceum]